MFSSHFSLKFVQRRQTLLSYSLCNSNLHGWRVGTFGHVSKPKVGSGKPPFILETKATSRIFHSLVNNEETKINANFEISNGWFNMVISSLQINET